MSAETLRGRDDLRLTTCRRKHTTGNVYNYAYWECGHCLWHPGGSDGPPNEVCLNCKRRNYTSEVGEAANLIRILSWEGGQRFEIVYDFSSRQLSTPPLTADTRAARSSDRGEPQPLEILSQLVKRFRCTSVARTIRPSTETA